ncbi:DUF6199 family natural product biosynthesis protein [Paenibacillus alkalitolerans]|uniref:DUF6199 family natural product biosynthesis protein n=1 Tax=Paenibacillus alkalitolerans TaxID=2799335 RepID=UPI0018F27BF4|nr:DUF6199 family natural product biosynthesis protein [Paenibacillus alkalitolerans]
MIFVSVLLFLFGLFMLIKPSLFWTVTEQWKSGDATEPSDLYIWSTRFGGGICTLVGVAGILIAVLL